VAARFPKYSFRNQLLILAQRPDARAVMGYRAWQAVGHQVRRGETSISILAPCTYKAKKAKQAPDADNEAADPEDEAEEDQPRRILRGFRIAHVFDPLSRDLTPGISGSWRWQNRPGGTTTVETLLRRVSRWGRRGAQRHPGMTASSGPRVPARTGPTDHAECSDRSLSGAPGKRISGRGTVDMGSPTRRPARSRGVGLAG